MTAKILVTEPLAEAGLAILSTRHEVVCALNPSPEELLRRVADCDALIVRSNTRVTAEVLAAAPRLQVVGRAGTGVDNIDVEAATRHGVIVLNAPEANTVAVAEHTLALMLALARHIPEANAGLHAGHWEKKRLMGSELQDKTLGLVGLGRVGGAVAGRAGAFGMHLLAYDPFVAPERAAQMGVELMALEELLARADYISLHVPGGERTRNIIDAAALARVKPGACLVNCARGDLVDEDALCAALHSGRLAGAALDVFCAEPCVSNALRACPNLLLTPHLGASTAEAQNGAGIQVARQVLDVLEGRPPRYPVNVTALPPEELAFLRPYLDLAARLGRLYAQLAEGHLTGLRLTYGGELADHDCAPLTAAALAGLLAEGGADPVNVVNAGTIARDRGLAVSESRTAEAHGFSALISLEAATQAGSSSLCGTVMRDEPHLVCLDGYWLDLILAGRLLVSRHTERPGVLGQMGTILGEAGVNIAFVQVGREHRGGRGLMVLGVDEAPPPAAIARVLAMPSIQQARLATL